MKTDPIILGIETSCDDTSLCILRGGTQVEVLSFLTFGQEDSLERWGGVVPEIAARNHLEKIIPLLETVLENANIKSKDIDLIGITTVPGLLGPLLTGVNIAKTISLMHEVPIVPINHLYAHLEAIHIDHSVSYPYLGLLISGGHSLFLEVNSTTEFKVLGSTIDDAAGEAFDKGGRLLGLPYPSGRYIDEISKTIETEQIEKELFPIGLRGSKDCRLSFSGLKTALKNYLTDHPEIIDEVSNFNFSSKGSDYSLLSKRTRIVIASYQHAIAAALSLKLKFALQKVSTDYQVVLGGGVACNSYIRKFLAEKYPKVDFKFVTPKYCTDNGAMIANLAYRQRDQAIQFPDCLKIDARGRFISKTLPRDAKK